MVTHPKAELRFNDGKEYKLFAFGQVHAVGMAEVDHVSSRICSVVFLGLDLSKSKWPDKTAGGADWVDAFATHTTIRRESVSSAHSCSAACTEKCRPAEPDCFGHEQACGAGFESEAAGGEVRLDCFAGG